MLHPSYSDLMKVVNSEVEEGETPVVNSRYSIVMATSKRARQIVSGAKPLVSNADNRKALSCAIEELETGKVRIIGAEEEDAPDIIEDMSASTVSDIAVTDDIEDIEEIEEIEEITEIED